MMKAAWGENMGVAAATGASRVKRTGAKRPWLARQAIRLSQLQEADLGVAHHQAQAVVLRVKFRVVDQVESGQSIVIGLRPDQVEQINRGQVEGITQGLPEGHGTVADAVEVGRDKLAPGGAIAPFHVLHDRSGGEALIQSQSVEKGLERRARGAPGRGAVVEALLPGAVSAGTHQGQDFMAAVGDDHRGGLGGAGPQQPGLVGVDDGLGPALQRQVQGGAKPLGRGFVQLFLSQDQVDEMGGFEGKGRGPVPVAPEVQMLGQTGLELCGFEIPQMRHAA